jgi:hypothetical protein
LAAVGLWQVLNMIRPGYATLFMGGPYRPQLYRWALGTLTVTICGRGISRCGGRIGSECLAIGVLVWPGAWGVVTAWLLPAMSYYGSLAAAAAGH